MMRLIFQFLLVPGVSLQWSLQEEQLEVILLFVPQEAAKIPLCSKYQIQKATDLKSRDVANGHDF